MEITIRNKRFFSTERWQLLLIALLCLILYSNTILHDYALDDKAIISKNPLTQQGISGIPEMFTHPQYYGAINRETRLYRPVPMATHALEYEIFGKSPHVSHFINILLYLLLCILIYKLLYSWLGSVYPALPFLATLLFVMHPIHTEVVANIKGRDEILTFIFLVASMITGSGFLRKKSAWQFFLCLLFYGLALFSKEDALPFLLIIPLSFYFFEKKDVKNQLLVFGLMVLLTIGYWMVRSAIFSGAGSYHLLSSYHQYAASPSEAMSTATGSFIDYLRLLFFPHPLVWSYSYNQIPLIPWTHWKAMLSILILAGLSLYSLAGLKRKHLPAFFILFFLLSWSIISNILFPISAVFAERFMFIPSLAFVTGLSWVLLKLTGNLNQPFLPLQMHSVKGKKILLVILLVLTLGYSVKTVSRNISWKDDFTLFNNDIRYLPDNVLANYFLAGELVRKSIHSTPPEKEHLADQALLYLGRSVAIDSTFYEGHFLSGILLFYRQNYPEAIRKFTTALQANPDFPDTTYSAEKGYGYIATSWIRMNRYPEAIDAYKKLIDFKPYGRQADMNALFPAYQNTGVLYNRMQKYTEAIPFLQMAVKIDSSSAQTWQSLGYSYLKTADYPLAEKCFLRSLVCNPSDARTDFYLGLTYFTQGKRSESGKFLEKAKSLDPAYDNEIKKLGILK